MPPKKDSKKEAPKKEKASNKGKDAKKKKWSKGKTREALDNQVFFDKATIEKLEKDVPKYKVITPSVLSDRLKISVSLAFQALKYLAKKKAIKCVFKSAKLPIYTRVVGEQPVVTAAPVAAAAAAPAKEKKEAKAPKA